MYVAAKNFLCIVYVYHWLLIVTFKKPINSKNALICTTRFRWCVAIWTEPNLFNQKNKHKLKKAFYKKEQPVNLIHYIKIRNDTNVNIFLRISLLLAVAQEAENQRDELKKQRTSYLKKTSVLKKELKMLKEQRKDLHKDSVPPSPTTKGFIDENEKLQVHLCYGVITFFYGF